MNTNEAKIQCLLAEIEELKASDELDKEAKMKRICNRLWKLSGGYNYGRGDDQHDAKLYFSHQHKGLAG